jgi:hypothetical protein
MQNFLRFDHEAVEQAAEVALQTGDSGTSIITAAMIRAAQLSRPEVLISAKSLNLRAAYYTQFYNVPVAVPAETETAITPELIIRHIKATKPHQVARVIFMCHYISAITSMIRGAHHAAKSIHLARTNIDLLKQGPQPQPGHSSEHARLRIHVANMHMHIMDRDTLNTINEMTERQFARFYVDAANVDIINSLHAMHMQTVHVTPSRRRIVNCIIAMRAAAAIGAGRVTDTSIPDSLFTFCAAIEADLRLYPKVLDALMIFPPKSLNREIVDAATHGGRHHYTARELTFDSANSAADASSQNRWMRTVKLTASYMAVLSAGRSFFCPDAGNDSHLLLADPTGEQSELQCRVSLLEHMLEEAQEQRRRALDQVALCRRRKREENAAAEERIERKRATDHRAWERDVEARRLATEGGEKDSTDAFVQMSVRDLRAHLTVHYRETARSASRGQKPDLIRRCQGGWERARELQQHPVQALLPQ